MVKRFTRHKLRPVATGNDDSNDNHYVEQKSQCQECQRKNVKATYRPLVNDNGAFLCDECYTNLYPATAMYDADENMFSKINQKIREKRANTKYPEEEECHACLEHGSYRRCCKHYYCRSCYYESGACPGCETPSHRSGVTQNQQRPSKMAVLATWGISVSCDRQNNKTEETEFLENNGNTHHSIKSRFLYRIPCGAILGKHDNS